jgi:cytochrome c peroxidase
LKPLVFGVAAVACCLFGYAHAQPPAPDPALVELGRALFFERNLSANRTQSCSSCHDPNRAFTDGRENAVAGAVSIGADGRAIGDRNAPTAAYAALIPPLRRDAAGAWIGGLFHDGRARDLADQAGQPILNPVEMQMPDQASVVARVRENPTYVAAIQGIFGAQAAESTDRCYAAVRAALAAFEQSPLFLAFDSRYDRYLKGEERLTDDEELGRMLFFSPLTNCSSCHQLNANGPAAQDPFTNYGYFNIGVPVNSAVRALNPVSEHVPDRGLGHNVAVDDVTMNGKFRVPTLRNVAVTGPYMHNGAFRELKTVVAFYNQYVVQNEVSATNPETGAAWGPSEFPATIDRARLRVGQPMDEERVSVLVAFLRTLTDQRYEYLLTN